jgi:thymidylate synthase (FAD)
VKVKLVAYTTPTEDLQDEGIASVQDFIAFCARVSNPSNQMNVETADRLIAYLIKHKHWSPFEMANICLEVQTSRAIARQLLRHRSFSFQEFSQRYAHGTEMGYELMEARLQDDKNRQNSIDTNDPELQQQFNEYQEAVWALATKGYEWAIANGIAKEQARGMFPEGLTQSRLYVNGSLRSWIHYIEVRTDPSTQKEHRLLALACAEAIAKMFPMINNIPTPKGT